jgi:hypothetical protein
LVRAADRRRRRGLTGDERGVVVGDGKDTPGADVGLLPVKPYRMSSGLEMMLN